MASAQIQLPGVKWREAIVKIDNDTYMKVQYLFDREVSDYKTLANLVAAGYGFGGAWVVNARGVTKENADSQDWQAYSSGSRAAAALLENSGESRVLSQRDDVGGTISQAQRDFIQASSEAAHNPRDQDAQRRLAEATLRLRQAGEERRGRPAGEAAEPAAETRIEEAPPEEKGGHPAPKAFAPEESEAANEFAETVGKARSLELFTPDDPRGISYGFEIHWKDGYAPKGEYDPSDIWSTERFLFDNLEGIDYYKITGFVDRRLDDSGIRQFGGDSFAVEYMRRAFLRLEDEIGGETVRLYVPREMDISGKTFADLINSPDVVAISVMEEGGEKFIWDIYAKEQEELLAALQKKFPDMEFVQA